MWCSETLKNGSLSNGQVKLYFNFVDNFTKKSTRQCMLGFRGGGVLISETAEVKAWNRITKTSQSTNIIRIHTAYATVS
ncbi:hypothetical protein Hanom_Chr11g00978451 [Helianthus anomalus]